MSEIRATTISDAAGTGPITLTKQSAAKAWVNFNGTGTIATRDSVNVASLTDSSTGQYYANYTNNMANDDYSFASYNSGDSGSSMTSFSNQYMGGNDLETGRIGVSSYNASFVDSDIVTIQVHGDLA